MTKEVEMNAVIIGATGLVGKNIVNEALKNDLFKEVKVFVRRSMNLSHPKLKEFVIDFDSIDHWKNEISGDVLFSALGTTLKAAGSKAAQYKVDHDYQLHFARIAAENGIKSYVLISSVNADSTSSFFYLKMKGELEEQIRKLPFHSVSILRPGPLKGEREKSRLSEIISVGILSRLTTVIKAPNISPVNGVHVAKISIEAALLQRPGINIFEPKDILRDHIL